jgi:hypothetical protein
MTSKVVVSMCHSLCVPMCSESRTPTTTSVRQTREGVCTIGHTHRCGVVTSSSRRIPGKYSPGVRRIFELTLRSQPVLAIEAFYVTSLDVDFVSALSDVSGRDDHELRRKRVGTHSVHYVPSAPAPAVPLGTRQVPRFALPSLNVWPRFSEGEFVELPRVARDVHAA